MGLVSSSSIWICLIADRLGGLVAAIPLNLKVNKSQPISNGKSAGVELFKALSLLGRKTRISLLWPDIAVIS
jgi:hypothetical protein